ncbi:DNA-deoxyinosine glycosylase [Gottschalkiaceae bacterium SANA]|nr:DNA-deoxyinosine glycosylase [Gottschalkiaceae bacterium SANA]
MGRIDSFEPIIGNKPTVLILGTMPSVKSLEVEEYYGFGRNQFWRIMGDLFGFDRNDPYEFRKACLIKHGIAVWDVMQSCERKGSLDKDIKNAVYNDIAELIEKHPSIKVVIANGSKARDVYNRQFRKVLPQIEMTPYYSTSPANAIAYDKKLKQWQELLDLIDS